MKTKYEILNDREWLEDKYIDEKLTTREIANIVGCAMGSVLNALNRHGISIRSSSEAKALLPLESKRYPLLNDKSWLRRKYEIEKLSTRDITKIVGCKTPNSVRQALIRAEIEVRNISDGLTCNSEDYFILNMPIIEGSLMGDASLSIWNSESETSYPFFHKKNKYREHIEYVARNIFEKDWNNRIFDNDVYPVVRTLSHKELKSLYDRWYPKSNNRKKVIPDDLDPCPVFLLNWFMDDGYSYHRRLDSLTKQIVILFCTECFTLENQSFLIEKINDKYDLKMSLKKYPHGGTGYRIQMPQSKSQDFFDLIGPPPVQSLAYKWK